MNDIAYKLSFNLTSLVRINNKAFMLSHGTFVGWAINCETSKEYYLYYLGLYPSAIAENIKCGDLIDFCCAPWYLEEGITGRPCRVYKIEHLEEKGRVELTLTQNVTGYNAVVPQWSYTIGDT